MSDILADFDVFFCMETFEAQGELPEENFANLRDAIRSSCPPNISKITKELGKQNFLFSPAAAFQLMLDALDGKVSCKGVQAILGRCPPVPEILGAARLVRGGGRKGCHCYGLSEKAAMMDRADVLGLLLDRGAGPNRMESMTVSPMEAALEAGSLECVELLLKRPDLDTAWTERLLDLWCVEDSENVALEFCRQAMARRFLEEDWLPLNPMPIPENMAVWIPAARSNWDMVIRICRERGNQIPLPEARKALACMDFQKFEEKRSRLGEAIDAVLTVCPELLRRESACRTVLRSWLFLSQEERAPLERWVKVLESRRVAMEEKDWQSPLPPGDFLTRWEKQLPRGPALVVDRWRTFPVDDSAMGRLFGVEAGPALPLERILRGCLIRGRGRRGELSPLAIRTLVRGSPGLIIEQLQSGKLLAQEDPDALLEYVRGNPLPRANRNAVLVSIKKEERYEL